MVRGQKKFVAYYRVSTDGQGVRGLGMEAQKSCVEQFVAHHDGRLLAAFQEVESGRKNARPQLAAAMARAQALGATLLTTGLVATQSSFCVCSGLASTSWRATCPTPTS